MDMWGHHRLDCLYTVYNVQGLEPITQYDRTAHGVCCVMYHSKYI